MNGSKTGILSLLRKIGFAEGLSWLLLLGIAMPLKYLAGQPLPVRIVGWIHGLLFVAYIIQLYRVQRAYRWPLKKTIAGCLAAFLPFGTWIFDAQLKKEQDPLALVDPKPRTYS
jgi:integral membrane protein